MTRVDGDKKIDATTVLKKVKGQSIELLNKAHQIDLFLREC